MPDRHLPEIYRAGSHLINLARWLFYAVALLGAGCAIGSNYVRDGWSEALLSLGWFCIGFAVAALLLFIAASALADHDADDQTPLTKETRPAS